MKHIGIKFILIALTVALIKAQSAGDLGSACIMQILKEKGLINANFPYPTEPIMCRFAQTIITSMENGVYSRFEDKENIDVDCVKQELKQRQIIYYILKKEVIEMSKKLEQEEINKLLDINKEDIKRELNAAAEVCNSDPKWGGAFNEFLGITNTSQPVLEQNYCFLKTSLDNNLIDIKNIDVNPNNIDTTVINCDAIIESRSNDITSKLREKYNQMGLPEHKTNCIISNLQRKFFFETTIALEVLEKLDIDPSIRAQNKEKLSGKLQNGIMGIFSCMF